MRTTYRGFNTGRPGMSGDADGLPADGLALERGLTILRQHGDDLFEVGVKFID